MRNDLTDITVVLDRSGSMASCRDDAENGLNHFVDEQKKAAGAATFTLVQFDTEYEFVHKGVDLKSVGRLTLNPRGQTALLDAVGRAIAESGERIKGIAENDRPGLVVFVIVTDGHENASREFTLEQVRAAIVHQQDVYRWQFTFLGANQDAFAAAGGMGIPIAAAANYTKRTAGVAFAAAASNVSRMRSMSAKGQEVQNRYTDAERADAAGDPKWKAQP
jgi:uncharacterized protein YegL